jgi:hypothetical protein
LKHKIDIYTIVLTTVLACLKFPACQPAVKRTGGKQKRVEKSG